MSKVTLHAWLMFLVFFVGACSQGVERIPVEPLNITADKLKQIYGVERGEFTVSSAEIELPPHYRSLTVKAFYPNTDQKVPLLVFSHGNWSDFNQYDNVIHHWVSHGYVVLAPYHADGGGMVRGIFNSLRYGQIGLIEERTIDIKTLLDSVPSIAQWLPALGGKIDAEKMAVVGHSFGAFTAQQMLGAGVYDPEDDRWHYARDARVRAVVALSPPGPMFDVITQDSWREMTGPVLMTTGTWDTNKHFWPDWSLHKMSYDTAQSGHQYALVVQGADHYLGNLICRPELDELPQYDALKMVNAVSTAFLDAYLKDNAKAMAFISDAKLQQLTNNFAQINQR